MSPEYCFHGKFSMKSDVYSFGVLMLEIISGQRNSNAYRRSLVEDVCHTNLCSVPDYISCLSCKIQLSNILNELIVMFIH